MKRLFLSLALPAVSLFSQNFSSGIYPSLGVEQTKKLNRILIENRVLAIVNNNPISVIDVMKKMDTEFFMEYPHLMDSDVARYQFYRSRWRPEFDRMVDTELILNDAKAHKIELTDGDIRQEMEQRFGSEIIANIDRVGLTYDETWEMVKKDILTQRMAQNHLYLRGVYSVSPDDLLKSYYEYIQKNKKPDHWKYYMISLSGPNALEDAHMAKQKLDQLLKKYTSFNSICYRFKEEIPSTEDKKISISNEFDLPSDKIQESHREVLAKLSPQTISEPIKEFSRVNGQPVYRLFYLTSYEPGGNIELAEVEDKLVYQLKQIKFEQEYTHYITRLRAQSGLSKEAIYESIPNDFEPFKMR